MNGSVVVPGDLTKTSGTHSGTGDLSSALSIILQGKGEERRRIGVNYRKKNREFRVHSLVSRVTRFDFFFD